MMENCLLLGVFVRERCPHKNHREADAPATFSFFSCQMERSFAPRDGVGGRAVDNAWPISRTAPDALVARLLTPSLHGS